MMAAQIITFPSNEAKSDQFEASLEQARRDVDVWADRVVKLIKDLRLAKAHLDISAKILEIKAERMERACTATNDGCARNDALGRALVLGRAPEAE